MTLHERIAAAVEKRLAVAQAATPGPWQATPATTEREGAGDVVGD